MSATIVKKQPGAAANRIHEQVQVAVAIHVGEHRPRGELVGTSDACLCRNIFKLPIPEIAIEYIRPFKAAEINIAPAVPIDVAKGETGAIFQHAVLRRGRVGKMIRERNAGYLRRQRSESCLSAAHK